MRVFVVHRSQDKAVARQCLSKAGKRLGTKIDLTFLDSVSCKDWREQASDLIDESELVVIFDPDECFKSENARWEIELAESIERPIVKVSKRDSPGDVCRLLQPYYDLSEEFDSCFSDSIPGDSAIELYKIMLSSSESLIQRRQKTSAFFITVIGSLMAIAGLMVKSGAVNEGTIWIMHGFGITALLLCNSWRNLIINYGKLNKAKFDVILRLERSLDAQIFGAEWVSLGKGLRPEKYVSFTNSEQNVPKYFAILVFGLLMVALCWQIAG